MRGKLFRTVLPALVAVVAAGLAVGLAQGGRAEQLVQPDLPPATTFVSIEFDDARPDRIQGADMLAAHGMLGTFYVISGRLDHNFYMTLDQVKALQAAGHEIGGHTVDHLALDTLSATDQRHQICDDRQTDLANGLQVRTLAYPFGRSDLTTEWYASACGYASARGEDGIQCPNCPAAEPLPPPDLYATRAPYSVRSTTTLQDLEDYVTTAEQAGGGWIQLIFHHLCETDCTSSDSTSWFPPSLFNRFLDWIKPRRALGTAVLPAGSVVKGAVNPMPPTIPPLPAIPPQTNLVQNPSFETVAPSCWKTMTTVQGLPVFARTSDARTGLFAQKITVPTASAEKTTLLTVPTASCQLPVAAGHSYGVSAWFKGTARPRFSVFLRDDTGTWRLSINYWASPAFFAATDWEEQTWTTPPMPSWATAMSVGFTLSQTSGTATVDDVAVSDLATLPPLVAFTSPSRGDVLSGKVLLQAAALDTHGGLANVDFIVNGVTIASDTHAPWAYTWDTSNTPNSASAKLQLRAVDVDGNTSLTPVRLVTVQN